jgi:hypothetical protein
MSTENNESFIDSEIINRAKTIAQTETYKDFADILGISSADFGQRKKRGTLLSLITRWAINQNVDLNYLLRGKPITDTSQLDPDPEIAELMEGARRVLTSGIPEAFDALERNIRYFSIAVAAEKRGDKIEKKIEELEADNKLFKEEIIRLRRENSRLDLEEEGQSSKKKVA